MHVNNKKYLGNATLYSAKLMIGWMESARLDWMASIGQWKGNGPTEEG